MHEKINVRPSANLDLRDCPHAGVLYDAAEVMAEKCSQHEHVDVSVWYTPFLYVTVYDRRKGYPENIRAKVSFDISRGSFYSVVTNRYGFSRRGWKGFMKKKFGVELFYPG